MPALCLRAFIPVLRRLNPHHGSFSIATGKPFGFLLLGFQGRDRLDAGGGLAMRTQENQRGCWKRGSGPSLREFLGSPGLRECATLSPEVISRHSLFPFKASRGALSCWCFPRRHLQGSSQGKASLAFPGAPAQGCSLALGPAVFGWAVLGWTFLRAAWDILDHLLWEKVFLPCRGLHPTCISLSGSGSWNRQVVPKGYDSSGDSSATAQLGAAAWAS